MVLRLNSLINRLVYYSIKVYQKFISRYTDRDCIYPLSCSHYAVNLLNKKSVNVFKDLRLIYKRVKGCKVVHIIQEDSCKWHAINGSGDTIFPESLNDKMRSNINDILSR